MPRYRLALTAGLLALVGGSLCIRPAQAAFTPRSAHTATLLPNRDILIVGGIGAGSVNALTSVQLLVAGTALDQTALDSVANGVARASHTATLLPNGEVLVAGGRCTGSVAATCNGGVAESVQVYNPIYNCWHAPIAATGRYDHTATLLKTEPAGAPATRSGKVLLCGGTDRLGNDLASCDLYTPRYAPASGADCTNADGETIDALTEHLQQGRAIHTATMLPDGRDFFAGGHTGAATPNTYTTTTEIYDPTLNTFFSAYPLSQGRAYHQATLSGGGKVVITGGFDATDVVDNGDTVTEPYPSKNSGVIRSVEIYDPVADHMSYAGLMPERRMMHTTTLMGGGQIEMLGGIGNITNAYRPKLTDEIMTGTITINCGGLPAVPCNITGTNLMTCYKRDVPSVPTPYQLQSPYRDGAQGLSPTYGDLTGVFKEVSEY